MKNDARYSNIFRGSNFMTPEFIGWGELNLNLFYEITSGRGLHNEVIYGLTIRDGNGNDVGKSGMYHSMRDVNDRIQQLRQEPETE